VGNEAKPRGVTEPTTGDLKTQQKVRHSKGSELKIHSYVRKGLHLVLKKVKLSNARFAFVRRLRGGVNNAMPSEEARAEVSVVVASEGRLITGGAPPPGDKLGGLRLSSRGSATRRTSQTLVLKKGSKFKLISRGGTSLPVLVSIFILFEFENIHRPLALVYHRLLMRLRLVLGNQHPIQVILEDLFRLLKVSPLRL